MRTIKTTGIGLCLSLSALGLTQTRTAFADMPGDHLDEIVVTAEKREQSLQTAPVTVSALTADLLAVNGGTGFSDLTGLAPGLLVNETMGLLKTVSIRGLGNEAPQGASISSVAVHQDGVYIYSSHALNFDFLDLDRIEVLRGPQGPVYGQTSTGGALNIVSNLPKIGVTGGNADLSIGNYNLVRVNAAANIPVSDTFAFRVAVLSNKHGGFAEALNVPGNTRYPLDDDNSTTARLSFLWQPADSLSVIGRFYYYNLDASAREEKNINDPLPDPRMTSSDYGTTLQNRTYVNSLTVKWNFGPAELTSISSWQQTHRDAPVNNDGLNYALAATYNPSPPFGHDLVPSQGGSERSLMQEFDLSSKPGDGPFSWLVGAFYHHYVQDGYFLEYQVANSTIPIVPQYLPSDQLGNGFEVLTHDTRTQWSVFGQGEYKITDRLAFTGGVRYNADRTVGDNLVYFATKHSPLWERSHGTTGKASLSFQATPDSLEYLTWSTGYKPGGTNIVGSSYGIVVPPTFGAEKNTAFEIGSKNEFFDHTIRVNISAFYYRYENLQVFAEDPLPFYSGTDSIPKSKIKGVEGEFSAKLGAGFKLDGNVEVERGTIDSDYLALDHSQAVAILISQAALGKGLFDPSTIALRQAAVVDVSGNDIPKIPSVSGNIALSDRIDVGNSGTLTARVAVNFRAAYNYNITGAPAINRVPSSTIANLSFRYDPANAPWAAEFLVLNVFDRADITTKNTDSFGVGATLEQFVPPRQFIGKVAYKF